MAFDPKPSTWLGAGYTVASHIVGLQTNDASSNKTLPQLTDALANATTGDIRAVAFAIAEALYQAWLSQAGSQPAKMTITRSAATGQNGTIIYTYTLKFVLSPTGNYTVPAE